MWVVLALLGWGCWLLPLLPSLVGVRLLVGFAAVLVLPGRAWRYLLKLGPDHWLLELAQAVALAVVFVAATAVIWMETSGSQASLCVAVLGVGTLGAIAERIRAHPRENPAVNGTLPEKLGVLLLVLLVPVFYHIGGTVLPMPIQEETLHLTAIRKLWYQQHYDLNGYVFVRDLPGTYLYAPYHLAMALISRIGGVDPVAVFLKIRPAFMIVSVAGMYGVLRTVQDRVWLADWGLLTLAVLVATGVAGKLTRGEDVFFCGQLAPVSHLADFAMGVLLPLLLYFMVRFLKSSRLWCEATLTFVLLTLATMIVHVRETLQILLYLVLVGTVRIFSIPRPAAATLRILFAVVVVVFAGKIYQARVQAQVAHLRSYEAGSMQQAADRMLLLIHRPLGGILEPGAYYDDPVLFRNVLALGIAASPLLILLWPEPWAVLTGAIVLGWMAIFRIPLLSYWYLKATYSEILMSPFRNVHLAVYLLVCIGAGAHVAAIVRRYERPGPPPRAWLLLAGSLLLWSTLPKFLSINEACHYPAFFLVLTAVLAVRWKGPVLQDRIREWFSFSEQMASSRHFAKAMAFVLVGLACLQQRPSLGEQWQAQRLADVSDEAAWYQAGPWEQQIPYRMIRAVRDLVPPRSILLYDFQAELIGPMMADVYVPCSGGVGWGFDVENFVDVVREVRGDPPFSGGPSAEQQARLQYLLDCMKNFPPVFSPGYSDVQQMEFLERLKVDCLLFDAIRYPHLDELIRRHPDSFSPLAEDTAGGRDFRLLRVALGRDGR